MEHKDGRRALVVGAGIAGLAAATRLHRDGWRVLVVERAPARRRGGHLINLTGSGLEAAEGLGLLPALRRGDLGAFASILTRADGTAKLTVPAEVAAAATGPRVVTVFRGDLEAALYEQADRAAEIRFGTTVRTIGDGGRVRVELDDDTVEHVDLLVGADGLHSGVRGMVFGPEDDHRVDLHHLVGAFALDRTPPGLAESSGTTFIGPRRTAAVFNLGRGRSSAFFAYRADVAADLERGPSAALDEAFGDLGGAVPDALAQLRERPEDAYFDSVSQIRMDAWSRGRVVLLGDAAWCVTLFAGHGAALALTGADRLGRELERHADVPRALAEWEAGLRERVARRQALARRGLLQFAPPTRAHVWGSELTMRAVRLPVLRGLIRRAIAKSR